MAKEHKLEVETSRKFGNWLNTINGILAFTTYQVGKVFMAGTGYFGFVDDYAIVGLSKNRENRTFVDCRSFI
jgi:hypothetical protein